MEEAHKPIYKDVKMKYLWSENSKARVYSNHFSDYIQDYPTQQPGYDAKSKRYFNYIKRCFLFPHSHSSETWTKSINLVYLMLHASINEEIKTIFLRKKKKHFGLQKKILVYKKIIWSIWLRTVLASVFSYVKQYSPLSIFFFNALLILQMLLLQM